MIAKTLQLSSNNFVFLIQRISLYYEEQQVNLKKENNIQMNFFRCKREKFLSCVHDNDRLVRNQYEKYTLCKNQELISVLKQGIFYANKISLTLLELAFIIYIYVYKHVVRLYSWNHRKHKTWNIIFVVTQNMQYYYNHAPEKELISWFINFKPIFAVFPWVYTMKLYFFFNRIPNLKTGYSWQDLYL